ncbi:MAG: ABC transporter ATP-binding protein [Alphaproteobacteria bacterium]|nr:ABC transporter ATP-binding protein [Alphaproteobacteria bacterium]
MSPPSNSLLSIERLEKRFAASGPRAWASRLAGRPARTIRAVDGVSLSVASGETVGLVGESGCGKSTLARCVVRLIGPSGGTVRFDGVDLAGLDRAGMRRRRRELQMVFQDPTASLNPRMTVRRMVEEPLRLQREGSVSRGEHRERVADALEEVGLGAELAGRYPHELSGGQRQRVNIARAIVTGPRLVVLDEPTSALDVSLRARVLLLLEALRERRGLSYLFISHDLATVRYLSRRVAVMYLGRIVEEGGAAELFRHPLHPYTRALLAAVPVPDPDAAPPGFVLAGEVAAAGPADRGCALRDRCPLARPVCGEPVALREVAPGRSVACHLV